MNDQLRLSALPLQLPSVQKTLAYFLSQQGLKLDPDVDAAFGIFDADCSLLACGCAAGNLLKCFAVDSTMRGQNLLGPIISALTQQRFSVGIYDLFIITSRNNESVFSCCGFYPLIHSDKLVIMENKPNGVEQFARKIKQQVEPVKDIGACVMNCNPFTLGHRALIEYASSYCSLLYVFILAENRSEFSADVRLQLAQEACADLRNVYVCSGGPYMISGITFPSYFLKDSSQATALQGQLDINLFAERIAPALNITVRFAGSEPLDPVTAQYNATMRSTLPKYGILFHEIPRITHNNQVISASTVRKLIQDPDSFELAMPLVPECTRRYLMSHRRSPWK
ncbi:MAG: [citrate (pro-3S)-lyase] ligase [Clostridiales bacterium]|nr:[citrate (pro-3S)-lyase] ligase [Clostridiales bacterium]